MIERRRRFGSAAVRSASEAICDRVRELPEWQHAGTVALYAGWGGEADPSLLAAWADSRRLAFPTVLPGEPLLRFFRVTRPEELKPGTFGIPAPPVEDDNEVAIPEIDLFLVPGVAFDGAGRRLGMGKGYYDQILATARPDATRAGIAFAWQLVGLVPVEPHDLGMDLVVTDERVLRLPRRSERTGA